MFKWFDELASARAMELRSGREPMAARRANRK